MHTKTDKKYNSRAARTYKDHLNKVVEAAKEGREVRIEAESVGSAFIQPSRSEATTNKDTF